MTMGRTQAYASLWSMARRFWAKQYVEDVERFAPEDEEAEADDDDDDLGAISVAVMMLLLLLLSAATGDAELCG